jgi:hypothetical protein
MGQAEAFPKAQTEVCATLLDQQSTAPVEQALEGAEKVQKHRLKSVPRGSKLLIYQGGTDSVCAFGKKKGLFSSLFSLFV